MKIFINVLQIKYQHMKGGKILNCIHWSLKKSLRIYTWIQIKSYYHPSKSPCTLFVFSKFFLIIYYYFIHYFSLQSLIVAYIRMLTLSLLFVAHCTNVMFITCVIFVRVYTMSIWFWLKFFVSFIEVFQPHLFYHQSLNMYALHGIYEFFASSFHNLSHGLVCWRIFL
jgi:hypothetical protein